MTTEKKTLPPMVFDFNSNPNQRVQVFFFNAEPWWYAKDVCNILGIQTKDVRRILDEDEVSTLKSNIDNIDIGFNRIINKHTIGKDVNFVDANRGGKSPLIISEAGVYSLVLKSRKPEAKAFKRWLTHEVIPAIRKKGYYGMPQKQSDFSDLRDVPYQQTEFNGVPIRHIQMDGEMWFSMNDIHRAIGSSTESTQAAKKLNKKQTLARKILLFGNTAPAWFTNQLGFQLLLSGSRMSLSTRQLELNFGGQA